MIFIYNRSLSNPRAKVVLPSFVDRASADCMGGSVSRLTHFLWGSTEGGGLGVKVEPDVGAGNLVAVHAMVSSSVEQLFLTPHLPLVGAAWFSFLQRRIVRYSKWRKS